MTTRLRGIAWDHPRAYRPLEAFERSGLAPGVTVSWDRQSLAGFESEPLAGLAERYDLLVIDHPGLGAAVASGALLAADEVYDATDLDRWRGEAVGPTWDSYRLDGRSWALPLDAATQACLVRTDLLPGPPPATWAEVVSLAARAPVALCLAGPHAALMLLAMAGDRSHERLLDRDRAVRALGVLREVWRRADQEASLLDPIGLHELLAAGDTVACCPLVYSYAAYGAGAGDRHALAWSAAPTLLPDDPAPGSTLGGTGLAVSARAPGSAGAIASYARALLDPTTQLEVVVPVGGQPAARAVWESPVADARWGGHYAATRDSVERAYVRPRYDGWIAFQDELSERVRDALRTDDDPAVVVDLLEADHRGRVSPLIEEGAR